MLLLSEKPDLIGRSIWLCDQSTLTDNLLPVSKVIDLQSTGLESMV